MHAPLIARHGRTGWERTRGRRRTERGGVGGAPEGRAKKGCPVRKISSGKVARTQSATLAGCHTTRRAIGTAKPPALSRIFRLTPRRGGRPMNGAMLLQHAAGVIEHRERDLRAAGGELRRHRRALVAGARDHGDPGAGGAVPDRSEAGAAHPRSVASRPHRRRRRLRRVPAGGDPCVARRADRWSGTCRARCRPRTNCSPCAGRRGASRGSW